jgi:hypothetical protein
MLKVLNPTIHGVLDYALAFFFLIAPGIFDFPENAATLSYVIGALYIGVSLITRYPLGIWKMVPFPTHGVLETLMAISWLALPWLLGFSEHAAARNFYLLAGVGLLSVVALTNYSLRAVERHRMSPASARR